MRHVRNTGLLIAGLVVGLVIVRDAEAADAPAGDIRITLESDGQHCVVHDVTILCSGLAAYLRDTLKLRRETTIHLQAARAASYQSVQTVLDIIEKSGFNHPVAYLTEPQSPEAK